MPWLTPWLTLLLLRAHVTRAMGLWQGERIDHHVARSRVGRPGSTLCWKHLRLVGGPLGLSEPEDPLLRLTSATD